MHERMKHIRLIKVKTGPEVLQYFFDNVVLQMPYLVQLKLQSVPLSRVNLTDTIGKHSTSLELLDLQDCQLSISQLDSITTILLEGFDELHSLNLSFNMAKEKSGRIVHNLCSLIEKESKLNHLKVSYMALGFDACQSICSAASKSASLCALHISGNQLS